MSKKKRITNRKGFTLIELMVATGIASTIVVGIGVILVDSQRGWNAMYERTYCDVVTDAHVARRMFDSTVRNASDNSIRLAEDSGWIEVYSYSDPNLVVPDLYTRFSFSNSELSVEYGDLGTGAVLGTETICGNVSSCVFKTSGKSAQMVLTLDDGDKSITVVASAVMHN